MKQASQRRVQAVVALKLLEVIRDRDRPGELLEDEDPTRTIPRRFGLSDVVERQIRQFREEAGRGGRLPDREVGDLFRLVIRRPDGDRVFHEAGRLLGGEERPGRWPRALPTRTRFSVARARAGKRLRKLFGRPVGSFTAGAFVLEGREHFLIDADPGGDACHLVSGLCEQVLAHTIGGTPAVSHTACRAVGDEICRWEGVLEAPPATKVERAGEQDADEGAHGEVVVETWVLADEAAVAEEVAAAEEVAWLDEVAMDGVAMADEVAWADEVAVDDVAMAEEVAWADGVAVDGVAGAEDVAVDQEPAAAEEWAHPTGEPASMADEVTVPEESADPTGELAERAAVADEVTGVEEWTDPPGELAESAAVADEATGVEESADPLGELAESAAVADETTMADGWAKRPTWPENAAPSGEPSGPPTLEASPADDLAEPSTLRDASADDLAEPDAPVERADPTTAATAEVPEPTAEADDAVPSPDPAGPTEEVAEGTTPPVAGPAGRTMDAARRISGPPTAREAGGEDDLDLFSYVETPAQVQSPAEEDRGATDDEGREDEAPALVRDAPDGGTRRHAPEG